MAGSHASRNAGHDAFRTGRATCPSHAGDREPLQSTVVGYLKCQSLRFVERELARRLTLVTARMRTAPTETRQRLNRGLTHPLDLTEEGLAMEATRTIQPATRGARHG